MQVPYPFHHGRAFRAFARARKRENRIHFVEIAFCIQNEIGCRDGNCAGPRRSDCSSSIGGTPRAGNQYSLAEQIPIAAQPVGNRVNIAGHNWPKLWLVCDLLQGEVTHGLDFRWRGATRFLSHANSRTS